MDTITNRIHDLYEVFAQLWEIVVDVTAVEIAYVFLIVVLLFCSLALKPSLKLLTAIGWETTMFVNSHYGVEYSLDRFQA